MSCVGVYGSFTWTHKNIPNILQSVDDYLSKFTSVMINFFISNKTEIYYGLPHIVCQK